MQKTGRKNLFPGSSNPWQSTLNKIEEVEPTQAGELPIGWEDEEVGGGGQGIDAQTGTGGYGGDAAEAGHDAAAAEPDRPLDSEIHGDPRTHEGEAFPDEPENS